MKPRDRARLDRKGFVVGHPVVALLGHGEAGAAFGRDLLDLGVQLRAYDPAVRPATGIAVASSESDAVKGADLVLSVNSASAAIAAFRLALPGLSRSTVWADLNTASPQLKRELAALADGAGVRFADVAIMAPVPGRGIRVPMLASGPAAGRVVEMLGPLGTRISVQPGEAGAAAERKLLRSVFFKGMAAAVVEALEAARAAGCEEWLRDNIGNELAEAGLDTVDRLVTGTNLHARRRADEMAAATQMLEHLGVEPVMARASRDLLRGIAQ